LHHQPDFVSLDVRGLKAALVEQAQAERVSVSVLVRRTVARELDVVGASVGTEDEDEPIFTAEVVAPGLGPVNTSAVHQRRARS
jgi:hypothetical protein